MRCLSSPAQLEATVHQALALGINHIETARGYGKSEVYLGQVLRKIPRASFYVTTKICPTNNAETMERAIEESLSRLQLDYVDNLAIHGINTPEHFEQVTQSSGCFSAIKKAQKEGKIKHIGFSTHGSLDLILDLLKTDLFDFINLHYYYFWQRNAPAIALAAEKDLGIFIISPGDKGGQLYTPSERLKSLCHPLTPLALTYRFLLSDPRITTLSLGPAHPDELTEPLQLADQDGPLTAQEQALFERLDQAQTETLASDRCRQCYQCLPCPENIAIPDILRLRNLAIAYDMEKFGQYRYQMLENAGHWFPGRRGEHCTDCGDCLPRCPEKLDIPQLLRDSHQRFQGSPRRRLWG